MKKTKFGYTLLALFSTFRHMFLIEMAANQIFPLCFIVKPKPGRANIGSAAERGALQNTQTVPGLCHPHFHFKTLR